MRYVLFWILSISTLCAQDQIQPYKDYDNDWLSPQFHKGRREALAQKMKPHSIAVLFSSEERLRSNDTYYQYKPESNFYYLTGFREPNATLIYLPEGWVVGGKTYSTVMFVPKRDYRYEVYNGRRMGTDGTQKILGIDTAFTNDEFSTQLNKILLQQQAASKLENVYCFNLREQYDTKTLRNMTTAFTDFRNNPRSLLGYMNSVDFINVEPLIGELRAVKTEEEIVLLKKSIEITNDAHLQMMKSCEPGQKEFEIKAVGEYVFTRLGAEYEGYGSICGSAENSIILHYTTDRRQMKDGDVLLVDMASEYHGYSADVTRSYPVNGKFTKEQAIIYNIVLKAQQAGIDRIKPNVPYREVADAITKTLEDGLLEIGLIQDRKDAKKYTVHGYMHSIGLDVHDPQSYDRPFVPGFFTTVEPGIYIPENAPCDKKWWNIGIRIEDDILVTESGNINLSERVPRKIEDIEKLMKKKGVGNVPLDNN